MRNGRGEIVLFAKDLAYRVNFLNYILSKGRRLIFGAQARYDAAEAGEDFGARQQDLPAAKPCADRGDLCSRDFTGLAQGFNGR